MQEMKIESTAGMTGCDAGSRGGYQRFSWLKAWHEMFTIRPYAKRNPRKTNPAIVEYGTGALEFV